MAKVHFNTAFENMSEKEINTWIVFNRKRLVGSAILTCNDSFTSKVVRWAENWGDKDKEKFTPLVIKIQPFARKGESLTRRTSYDQIYFRKIDIPIFPQINVSQFYNIRMICINFCKNSFCW